MWCARVNAFKVYISTVCDQRIDFPHFPHGIWGCYRRKMSGRNHIVIWKLDTNFGWTNDLHTYLAQQKIHSLFIEHLTLFSALFLDKLFALSFTVPGDGGQTTGHQGTSFVGDFPRQITCCTVDLCTLLFCVNEK